MPQDNPPLLDKTMNTTESTPRNLADVLASGLASIANNVKPDGSNISINVPGMSANNVDEGFSELKQSLDSKVSGAGFIKFYGSKDARYCKITCPSNYRYGVLFVITSKAVYQIQANGSSHVLNHITGETPTVSERGDILTIDSGWAYSQWGVILMGGVADYTTKVAFTAS